MAKTLKKVMAVLLAGLVTTSSGCGVVVFVTRHCPCECVRGGSLRGWTCRIRRVWTALKL